MLRLSTPFARRSSAALLGVSLAGSIIAASPAQAAERVAPVERAYSAADRGKGITLKAGPILLKKYGFKDEHLGLLTVNGKPGICYDYGEKSPDGGWKSGAIADVKPGRDRDRMQWIANRYWADAQKSDAGAAAYKSAINLIRSKEFASDWKSSYAPQLKKLGKGAVVAQTERMVAESAKFAAPVKLALDYSKPAPGAKGTATVKVTVGGKAYPGMAVKWALSGALAGTSSKVTGKDGTAKLTFTRGGGPVSVNAVAAVPEWREAGYTIPSNPKIQHLIRGGFSTSVTASGKFDSLLSVKGTPNCEPFCDGTSQVTVSTQKTSSPSRWQGVSAGKVVPGSAFEVPAGKSGRKSFAGRDGQTIGLQYSVKVNGKWSAWRSAGSTTVVCPAWPKVELEKSCPCKGERTASYTFAAPGGIRFYDVTLNGQTKRISGQQTVTMSVSAKAGATVTASFAAYDKAGKKLSSGVLDAWTQN